MSEPAKILARGMPYEEFLEYQHETERVEWVDGEIVEMAPVNAAHDDIQGFLFSVLRSYVREKKLGRVCQEPFQMKTGPGLPGRSPDILFIATRNLKRMKPNYLEGPADLVIEIVSPESGVRDRGVKFEEYEAGGVQEYWLIDPNRRLVNFYDRDADGLFHESPLVDGIFRSSVIDGVWISADWLFRDPLPSEIGVLMDWGAIRDTR